MRGIDVLQESLFTLRQLDDFVPATHPLRPIRDRVNQALVRLDGLFARIYAEDAKGGRPRIAPEKLLRAMLLQVFHSVRSERQWMEQVQYNLLFRWFSGLSMDDAVWVPTVFSKNRGRLIEHEVIVAVFNDVLAQSEQDGSRSGEHFRVDGTLIQAFSRQRGAAQVHRRAAADISAARACARDAGNAVAGYRNVAYASSGRRVMSGTRQPSAGCPTTSSR